MEKTYFLGEAEGVEVALKTNAPAMGQGPGGRVFGGGFIEEVVNDIEGFALTG